MKNTQLARLRQEIAPHTNAFMAAVGALVGAEVFFYMPFDPWWGWGLPVLGVGLIGMGLARERWFLAVAIGLMIAGLAFCLAGWQVARVVPLDYRAARKVHWMVGEVTEIHDKDTSNRATLRLEKVELFGLGRESVENAGIGVYKSQLKEVVVGGAVALPVVLMAPEGPVFKGQRDARVWRYFDENRVGGYVLGTVEPTHRSQKPLPWGEQLMQKVAQWRAVIYEGTKGLAGGAVAALLVGNERSITPELREAYRNTGLSHLLAISGMQMTLVALGIYGILRWLGALVPWVALRVDIRIWAAIVSLGGTFVYTFLAGASVSLVRATIMTAIVMLAVITGRMSHAVRGWCVAVVLIVLVNPLMVTRAGFQLSIAAVLSLVLLAQVSAHERVRGVWWWLKSLVAATVVAGSATAPVLVWQFGQFTVLGMVANLLAVPVMTLATYCGMLALVLWPLGWQALALGPMTMIVEWVNRWALWVGQFELATVEVDRSLWWVVAVAAIVIVGCVLVKRRVEAGVALVGLSAFMVAMAWTAPVPEVRVWENGKIGIARVEGVEKLLWAEDVKEAKRLAKLAGVDLVVEGEVSDVVDERFMPVTEHEHFAWAEKVRGRWEVEPVACGRVWMRVSEGCW